MEQQHTARLSRKQYVLGLDVGGTGIKAQLFALDDGHVAAKPLFAWEEPSTKGLAAHTGQVIDMIAKADEKAGELGGRLAAVGVGSPGRFDEQGHIKPGTNPSLGETINEFDDINLKKNYELALRGNKITHDLRDIPLAVANDGNAMLAGMLEGIQDGTVRELKDQHGYDFKKLSLRNRYVGLLGLGTGLGHAIAEVKDGGFRFVTDGHASKLLVKVDDADWPVVARAMALLNKGKTEVVVHDGHKVRAEDLVRGPVVQALLKDGMAQDEVTRFSGKYLARLIGVIASGESQDVESANGWSNRDKALASRTSVYLVGGGLGSSETGRDIIRHANEEMQKNPAISGIRLVQMSENSAARAAAVMAQHERQAHRAREA